MSELTKELDWSIRQSPIDGEFEVWTPDYDGKTGAIIGNGKTREEAILNAIKSMASLQHELIEALEDRGKPVDGGEVGR